VAFAYSGSGVLILLPIMFRIAGRRGPVSTRDLSLAFLRHLPVWGVVSGTTFLTRSLVANSPPLTQLFICAPVGLLAGVVFILSYAPSRRTALSLFHALREWKRFRGLIDDANLEAAAACPSAARSAPSSSLNRLWGIFSKKERWSLSWRGWLACALTGLLVCCLLLFGLHPFLAITHRVGTDILVVEGWIHEHAVHASVDEFKSGSYPRVFTTGGPVPGSGGYINDFNTSASVCADLLKKAGIPADVVQIVPSRVVGRDRTYSSAVALRNWFQDHNMTVRSIDVVTEDAHARRTRLLFQKAFGPDVAVGVISIPNPDYDAKHWWRYSEGVREVIGESIAYLYARIFFHPSAPEPK
jgi:uncharacterized SAM-binding protein YcdF (DUF218 family)